MANVSTGYAIVLFIDRVQGVDPSYGGRSKLTKDPNGLGVKGTVPHEQPQHRALRPQDLKHPPQNQKRIKLQTRQLHPRGQTNRLRE